MCAAHDAAMDEPAYKFSELLRRIENIVQRGVIVAVDTGAARVRVALGANETDWLPWLTLRAGTDRTWWAPDEGEQVIVFSESGDFNNGFVLPASYSDAHPAPENDPHVAEILFGDGAILTYDKGSHTLDITLPDAGEISLNVGRSTLSLTDAGTLLKTPSFEGMKA